MGHDDRLSRRVGLGHDRHGWVWLLRVGLHYYGLSHVTSGDLLVWIWQQKKLLTVVERCCFKAMYAHHRNNLAIVRVLGAATAIRSGAKAANNAVRGGTGSNVCVLQSNEAPKGRMRPVPANQRGN